MKKELKNSTIEKSTFLPRYDSIQEVMTNFSREESALMLKDKFNGYLLNDTEWARKSNYEALDDNGEVRGLSFVVAERDYTPQYLQDLHERAKEAGFQYTQFDIRVIENEEYDAYPKSDTENVESVILKSFIQSETGPFKSLEDIKEILSPLPVEDKQLLGMINQRVCLGPKGHLNRFVWLIRYSDVAEWDGAMGPEILRNLNPSRLGFNYHEIYIVDDWFAHTCSTMEV